MLHKVLAPPTLFSTSCFLLLFFFILNLFKKKQWQLLTMISRHCHYWDPIQKQLVPIPFDKYPSVCNQWETRKLILSSTTLSEVGVSVTWK